MKEFFKKNFTIYHILGIALAVILAAIYWYKMGQFSDYFLKNNLFIVCFWASIVGYITGDLVYNAVNRANKG